MNDTVVEVYHRTGAKVVIKDIPTGECADMSFDVMWKLQKLIDDIDRSSIPDDYYSFTDII